MALCEWPDGWCDRVTAVTRLLLWPGVIWWLLWPFVCGPVVAMALYELHEGCGFDLVAALSC